MATDGLDSARGQNSRLARPSRQELLLLRNKGILIGESSLAISFFSLPEYVGLFLIHTPNEKSSAKKHLGCDWQPPSRIETGLADLN